MIPGIPPASYPEHRHVLADGDLADRLVQFLEIDVEAPRSASSSCTCETLNAARSSTRGRTCRCAAVTPSDGPEIL